MEGNRHLLYEIYEMERIYMAKLSDYIDVPDYNQFGFGLEYVKFDTLKDKFITITGVRFYTKRDETGAEREKAFISFKEEGSDVERYTNTGSTAIIEKLKAVAEVAYGITEDMDTVAEWDLIVTIKQRKSKETGHTYWDMF